MIQLVHVHVPGLERKDLMQCIDAGHLEVFRYLVENGEISILPCPGYFPAGDISIATGEAPEKHNVFYADQIRSDGFGIEPLTSNLNRAPAYWEELDAAAIPCCVVNWCATRHGALAHGVLVADTAMKILSANDDTWGVPPGSVFPFDVSRLIGELRLHPEFLTREQVLMFDDGPNDRYSEEQCHRLVARMLCEMVSAHSIATHFLEQGRHRVISIRYPALQEAREFFSPFNPHDLSGAMGQMASLIDQFLGRILALTPDDAHIIVSGGGDREGTGYVIRKGPGIVADSLGKEPLRYEDLKDIILRYFPEVSAAAATRKSPAGSEAFETVEQWEARLLGLGYEKTAPTMPQEKFIAHCLQQNAVLREKYSGT